ncbi:MAG: discoidin domain-containing protein [Clostridia bacterium]|nr:discoidin domain-containing protein [Clostridia bacterium]
MKKIVALLLCFVMLVPQLAFAAESEILVNSGFEEYATNYVLNDGLVEMRSKNDKALSYTVDSSQGYNWGTGIIKDSFYASLEISFKDNVPPTDIIELKASNGNKYSMYKTNGTGAQNHDGKRLEAPAAGKWNKVEIVVNKTLKCYSLYLNGNCILNRYKMPFDLNSVSITDLSTTIAPKIDTTATVKVDNFRVSTGLLRNVIFPKERVNPEELELSSGSEGTVDQPFQLIRYIDFKDIDINNHLAYSLKFQIFNKSNAFKVVESGGRNWYRLYKTTSDPHIDLALGAYQTPKRMYQELDIMYKSSQSNTNIFHLKDNLGNSNVFVYIKPGGDLYTEGGEKIGSLKPGVLSNLVCEIDIENNYFNVYQDGKIIAKKIKFAVPYTGKMLQQWRIYFYNGGASDIYLGKYAIYAASELTKLEERDDLEIKRELRYASDEAAIAQAKGGVAFARDGRYALINNERVVLNYTPRFDENDNYYVPAEILEKGFGAKVEYKDGSTVVNGIAVKGGAFDGGLYAEISDVCENVLKKNYFVDRVGPETGFGIIGDADFSEFEDSYKYREINDYLIFDRPKQAEILADFDAVGANKHPRVYAGIDKINALVRQRKTVPWKKRAYEQMVDTADKHVDEADYNTVANVVIPSLNDFNQKTKRMCLVYLATKEQKYLDRLWYDIQQWGNLENWNHSHFLDVASVSMTFSMMYDWLYDYWTEDQRKFIADKIAQHALNYAIENAYGNWAMGVDYARPIAEDDEPLGNWNIVCQTGLIMGALAIMDRPEYRDLCAEVIEIGLRSIEYSLIQFAPDGSWEEGPTYWDFTWRHMSYLFETLKLSLGKTYGYLEYKPLQTSIDFAIGMSMATGTAFAVGDANTGNIDIESLPWLVNYTDNKEHLKWLNNIYENNVSIPDFNAALFLDADKGDTGIVNYNQDIFYESLDTGISTSGWGNYSATALGYHCGTNMAGHMNFDSGTFALDMLGVRWIDDIGRSDYTMPNYNGGPLNQSASYAVRTEGNNCYVINPSLHSGQIKETYGQKIISKGFTDNEAFVVMDITASYADNADKALRGFKLSEDRQTLTIRDEIKIKDSKPNSVFYSFMHTLQSLKLGESKNVAYFEGKGKTLKAELISNQPLEFAIMEAEMLPTSPAKNSLEWDFSRFKKLAVKGNVTGQVNITVKITPVIEGIEFAPIDDTPLANWTATEANYPKREMLTLEGINVNGKPLSKFVKGVSSYNYTTMHPETATVDVIPGEGYDMYSYKKGDTFTYVLRQKDRPTNIAVYTVTMVKPDRPEVGELDIITPEAITASKEPQPANGALNIMDGDMGTRWSADGAGVYTVYEFDEAYEISVFDIAALNPQQRTQAYEIHISNDGVNYTKVYEGNTNFGDELFTRAVINPVKAKYVKLVCNNATNMLTGSEIVWNSIVEFYVYGK